MVRRPEPGDALKARPSRIIELPGEEAPGGRVRYYQIGGFRYRSPDAQLASFLSNEHERLREPAILSDLCQPIWDLISRRDFKALQGRLVFRGIAATPTTGSAGQLPAAEWAQYRADRDRRQDRHRRTHFRLQPAAPPAPQQPWPAFCPTVRNALDKQPEQRNEYEQRIAARVSRFGREQAACHARLAREQAYGLYRICERAPARTNTFQDQHYLDRLTYVDEARQLEMRDNLWEHVDYGAYFIRPLGRSPPSPTPLALYLPPVRSCWKFDTAASPETGDKPPAPRRSVAACRIIDFRLKRSDCGSR